MIKLTFGLWPSKSEKKDSYQSTFWILGKKFVCFVEPVESSSDKAPIYAATIMEAKE